MTLQEKTQVLRQRLRQWAAAPEWKLLVRYELLPQNPSPVRRKRLAQRAGRLLRVLGFSRARYRGQTWHPGLKHAGTSANGRTLLIWSDILATEAHRKACGSLRQTLSAYPELCPVLVTGVADFSFYSRLGWLVEYLPDISGEGSCYRERKQRYLAWRYRHAVAIPLSAGLADAAACTLLLQTEC